MTAELRSYRPLIIGRRGAVAANHPLAAQAGLMALRGGGNAVDAAVATAVTPDLNSGFKKEEIFQWLGVPDRGLSTAASRLAGQTAGCGFGSGIS